MASSSANQSSHRRTLTLDVYTLPRAGVEYRALRLLSYIVAGYFVVSQLVAFLLFYPYLAVNDGWDSVFAGQPRQVPKALISDVPICTFRTWR